MCVLVCEPLYAPYHFWPQMNGCLLECRLAAPNLQEYKQRKRLGGGREKETLQRLAQFGKELKATQTKQAAPAEQQQQQKEQQAAEQQNGQQPASAKQGDAGELQGDKEPGCLPSFSRGAGC